MADSYYPTYDRGAVQEMHQYDRRETAVSALGSDRPAGALQSIAAELDNLEGGLSQTRARLESHLATIFCQPPAPPRGSAEKPREDVSLPAIMQRLSRIAEVSHDIDALSRNFADQV